MSLKKYVSKPTGKRRASPLKDSPVPSDDDHESSDYVMGEINDEKKSKSDLPEEEEADYDLDSDTDEDKKPAGRPLEERPKQKAMPMQPPVPPLRLTPKTKAQPSATLDDETESDNAKHQNEDRPPLPRRPTMKAPPASIDHSKWTNSDTTGQFGVMLLKGTTNPSPFWNSKFLSFVQQYYRECCTIQQKHPDFDYVPEHLRRPHEKPCCLKTKFNDLWEPTIRGEDAQGEKAYMAYIKKIYSMCCPINDDDPKNFSTEVIPTVSRNGQIDMDKTIINAESVCTYYGMDPSYANPIVHFILWRVERMSRLFSKCLRHNPREGREMRRPIRINLDGSCELYEALCTITHARNFLGNIPGVFLMTMLSLFGKSRYEIAFVYPKFDGKAFFNDHGWSSM